MKLSKALESLLGMNSSMGNNTNGEKQKQKLKEYPIHRLLPYKVITIDLGDKALDKKEFAVGGDYIKINLTEGASAYLQLDSIDADTIDLSLHTRIEIPSLNPMELDHFEKFYITADKQTDKTLVLTIGQRGRFKIY